MCDKIESKGYKKDFLGKDGFEVPLIPIVESSKYQLVELIDGDGKYVLDYNKYSVVMDRERKFPIIAAANINGDLFKKLARKGSFKKDRRIDSDMQWGNALYSAPKSKFDKGHMTKREDVQWDNDEEIANAAAISTFFYTNAIPQHHRLNRSIWRSLEDYILKTETVKHNLKVNVFTGPILAENDPDFVTEVKNQKVKLPVLFWKIVYYIQEAGGLHRTAFLVSQKGLLEDEGVIKRSSKMRSTETEIKVEERYFMNFKKAETYQIQVSLVEELTGLQFPKAVEIFSDSRPRALILKDVIVRGEGDKVIKKDPIIKNLIL